MKRKTHCLTAVLLAAALLLGLTACKEKETHKVNFQTAQAYTAEDIPLPVPTGDLLGCCTDGETMYILADELAEEEVRTVLCRVNLADGTVSEMEDFQATTVPDDGGKNVIGPILAPDGTLWLYEMWTISYYDLPEDFDETTESAVKYLDRRENFHHLRQLDPVAGRQKKLVDLSDGVRTLAVDDILDVSGVAVDRDGNFYFAGTGGVAVLDKNMDHLFTLKADLPRRSVYNAAGSSLALLPDGRVAALIVQPGGKREVRPIDAGTKSWGKERYAPPGGVDLIYGGTGGFLFYYISAGSLFAWEPEAAEGRLLLNWSAAELNSGALCFAPLDGGKLAAVTARYTGTFSGGLDYFYTGEIRLTMLSPTDQKPSDGKTRLVYGTIGADSVQRLRIKEFNDTSDRYYIELRNYAGEGVEKSDVDRTAREAAQKLLHAEIVSGRAPDIWDTTLPTDLYARKGVLEDLWPWIDGDPEISRDTLMSHVLDCASVDGELYSVFNSFNISTFAALSEVAGNRTSWTLEEVMAYYEAMPEGSTLLGIGRGKKGTLYNLIHYTVGQWIDWTNGACSFDSEEFKAVLKLCGSMADDAFSALEEPEKWNNLANGVDLRAGRQLMEGAILDGVGDILGYEALAGGPQCLADYETYLDENDIFAFRVDDNGNWRDESALICEAYSLAASYRFNGQTRLNTLSPDAVFGVVEGGGYVSYPGAPSASGAGSSFGLPGWYSHTERQLSISASCQAKEGAWEYVRQCLLPGDGNTVEADRVNYLGGGFPINKADFDALLEPKWFQRENEDGSLEYVLDRDGNRIEEPQGLHEVPSHYAGTEASMVLYQLAPNELQMERFWALYNAIDRVGSSEETIMQIIMEQADAYFAGDKSLDETADLIQRRATLYVNENR